MNPCPMTLPNNDVRELARKTCEFAADIEIRLSDGDTRLLANDRNIAQITADLAENTASTKRIDAATSDIVEFFASMKGAFKVLNWIGKLAMPLGAIIGMCTAIWGAWIIFKNGGKP